MTLILSIGLEPNTTPATKSNKQSPKSYPIILKLINGSLTGGVKYKEVYMETLDDHQNNVTYDNQTTSINNIPTLEETARKVARLENMKLDKK